MTVVPRFFRDPDSHYFLFGPRGTGKSTWLRATYDGALWLDLLKPEVRQLHASHPGRLEQAALASAGKRVVVIDEVQKAPELLDVVHSLIEEHKGRFRFVLTGSSARKLKRTGVNLLGGRVLRRTMHPFLASELGDAFRMSRALTSGLVPGIWFADKPAEALKAYVALYVREEVEAEGLVRNLGAFGRFLEAISLSHASPLNLANVARDCGVSRTTVEGYLGVLKDLLLAFEVGVFTRRAKRQMAAHPKLYWFDTGVFRAVRPAGPLDAPEEIGGAALEGLVAQHLRAWIDYSGADLALSYWRTKSGNEVDFVVYGRDGFWGIEVKNSRRVRPEDMRGLKAFAADYPQAKTTLLHMGSERLRIDGVLCQPCEEFLRRLRPGAALPP